MSVKWVHCVDDWWIIEHLHSQFQLKTPVLLPGKNNLPPWLQNTQTFWCKCCYKSLVHVVSISSYLSKQEDLVARERLDLSHHQNMFFFCFVFLIQLFMLQPCVTTDSYWDFFLFKPKHHSLFIYLFIFLCSFHSGLSLVTLPGHWIHSNSIFLYHSFITLLPWSILSVHNRSISIKCTLRRRGLFQAPFILLWCSSSFIENTMSSWGGGLRRNSNTVNSSHTDYSGHVLDLIRWYFTYIKCFVYNGLIELRVSCDQGLRMLFFTSLLSYSESHDVVRLWCKYIIVQINELQ